MYLSAHPPKARVRAEEVAHHTCDGVEPGLFRVQPLLPVCSSSQKCADCQTFKQCVYTLVTACLRTSYIPTARFELAGSLFLLLALAISPGPPTPVRCGV